MNEINVVTAVTAVTAWIADGCGWGEVAVIAGSSPLKEKRSLISLSEAVTAVTA